MRRELKIFEEQFPRKKTLRDSSRAIRDTISMWLFKRKLRNIVLGSREWHVLQEEISRGASVGIQMEKRNTFYQTTLRSCGPKLYVMPGTILYYPTNIEIGYNVFINRGVFITAPVPITIGDNVIIGPYVIFNTGSHNYADATQLIRDQGHKLAPILVGDDVWIGAHALLLPGVTIGTGAVVAAGAVVSKPVEPYTVVAGVPARAIRRRS